MRERPSHRGHQGERATAWRVCRTAMGVLLGLAILTAAGCGSPGSVTDRAGRGVLGGPPTPSTSAPSARPAPDTISSKPAQTAGGACKLLDYGRVKAATGTQFHVAVARSRGATQSCVLQVLNSAYPDLILTLAPTRADATIFKSTVVPQGAQAVPELGKAAYSTVTGPRGAAGAAVEVGWLGDGGRILTIRYTHQTGTKVDVARKKVTALVTFARKLEAAR